MKKILSMLLSCVIVLSTIHVFAKAASETGKTYDKEVHLLTQLGMIEINKEEDFSRPVTRAEFVDYIAKFYGETNKGKRYFSDVDENYWAFNSIASMTDKGLIARPENGLFYPERIISLNEACKIVMTAAGYDKYAEASGGYAFGYYNLAKSNKIIPRIENVNSLRLGECLEIIYNSLIMGICEGVYNGSGNDSFRINAEKSLLGLNYDMYEGNGRLTSMYGASMAGTRLVKEKNIAYIDNEEYYVGDDVLKEEYFTDYVDFIYRENDDDTRTLIYVEPAENKNDDITVFSGDIKDFDERSYTLTYYNDDDRIKTIDFSRGAQIIYNGREYTGSVQAIFDEFISKSHKGTVKIKDIDDDGTRDAVIIKSYRNIVVGYIDTKATQFYNAYDSQDYFDIEDIECLTIKNSAGNEMNINPSSIKVLSVAASKDNQNAEIIICDEVVSGSMRGSNTKEGTITIDEKIYDADKLVFDRMNLPALNVEITAILDQFGYVTYITQASEYAIGYLTRIKPVEDETILFRIYEQNGTINEYPLADKVTIDGERFESRNVIEILENLPDTDGTLGMSYTQLEGDAIRVKTARQVIRYTLNNDNQIKKIDTMYLNRSKEEKNSTLQRTLVNQNLAYGHGVKGFGIEHPVDLAGTIFFAVPEVNSAGDVVVGGVEVADTIELYANKYTIDHDKSYTMDMYKFNPDVFYTDVIVVRNSGKKEDTDTFLVREISQALEGDDIVTKIEGYSRNTPMSFILGDRLDVSNIKQGDLLQIWRNEQDTKITDFKKVYNSETLQFEGRNVDNPYWWNAPQADIVPGYWYYGLLRNNRFNLLQGYVAEKKGNYIAISYEKGGQIAGYFPTAVPIMVIDSGAPKSGQISAGTVADLMDYKSTGGRASKVVLANFSGTITCIYVYR